MQGQGNTVTRWVVIWGDRYEFEAYFKDRALAEAYAASKHGVVKSFTVENWPARTLT